MRTANACWIAFVFVLGAPIAVAEPIAASANLKLAVDAPIPGGISSVYTDRIPPVLRKWPRPEIPTDPKLLDPIWMRAVHNPQNDFHVGIIKRMHIRVPLKRMIEVIEDWDGYFVVFPSLKNLNILKTDGNFIQTFWEHSAPLPFLPNAKYEQAYIVDKRDPKKAIYRYQLIKGTYVDHTDGFFVLEDIGPNLTQLTGYDFFQPDLGPLKIFGAGRVWKDGTEGSFKGDISMKLHAENPDWGRKKIKEEAEKILEAHPIFPLQEIESGPFAVPAASPSPSASPAATPNKK